MKRALLDSADMRKLLHHHRLVIGVPIFNEVRHLADCLESIRSQSDRDFLVILSDNASTDGCIDICESAVKSDSRFILVRHQSNRGSVANFNYLRRASSSPFFAWVGAHDVLGADYVSAHLRALHCDARAAVSFSPFSWIDKRSMRVSNSCPVGLGDIRGPGWWRYLWSLTSGDVSAIHGVFRRSMMPSFDLEPCTGTDHVFLSDTLRHGYAIATKGRHYFRRDLARADDGGYMERVTGVSGITRDRADIVQAHQRLIGTFGLGRWSSSALACIALALLKAQWVARPVPLWYRLGPLNVWRAIKVRHRLAHAISDWFSARV